MTSGSSSKAWIRITLCFNHSVMNHSESESSIQRLSHASLLIEIVYFPYLLVMKREGKIMELGKIRTQTF